MMLPNISSRFASLSQHVEPLVLTDESPTTTPTGTPSKPRLTHDGRTRLSSFDASSPTAGAGGARLTIPGSSKAHSSPSGLSASSPKTPSARFNIRFSPGLGASGESPTDPQASPLARRSDNGGLASARDRLGTLGRASSSNLSHQLSTLTTEALKRFDLIGTESLNGSDDERHGDKDGAALKLPDLAAAARKSLPRLKSGRSSSGFIQRHESETLEASTDDDDDRGPGSKLGPGGLASKYDKKYYKAREDDVLYIASNMGMVRKEVTADPMKTMTTKSRAGSQVAPASNMSHLGVQLSVLTRFSDSISTDLSTAEVVAKYITPQTQQLHCRFIDLVTEKMTDTPGYYLVHCWSMGFKALVDTLRKYFEVAKVPESDVVLWIDIYCVNQHRPLVPSDVAMIADIIKNTDKVLCVLDRPGVALSRTWIMWELWQVAMMDRAAIASGSPSSAGNRLIVLPVSWSWDCMYHAFITMDVSKSLSSQDKERGALIADMTKEIGDPLRVTEAIQEVLRNGGKRDMLRANKLANVNPRRYIHAATTYAMLLYHSTRYIEAEDVMKGIKALIDKANPRDLQPEDEAGYLFHMALIQKEKGANGEAHRILVDFDVQCKGGNDELYLTGEAVLVDLYITLKQYTKAEMLCRKTMELRDKTLGHNTKGMVRIMLQMAAISAAQRLYDEAEDHSLSAMKLAHLLDGPDGVEAAACYHMLAICYYYTNRKDEVKPLLERGLKIRKEQLGPDHPVTLESLSLQAMMLVQAKQLREAEVLLGQILRSRTRSYGAQHHDTLESMGTLADLLRTLHKDDDAKVLEKRVIEIGRELLGSHRINRFRSLKYIAHYLVKRERLLDKAALFLAKAFIVYKEKLGSEADLTLETKNQLLDIIAFSRQQGTEALNNAELFHAQNQYAVAEDMLKQAWSLGRLVQPEEDHREVAQGLADALFAQEKIQEAKSVMRTAGLVKKGMKQNMPASYLRWLNKRVAKYMDKQDDDLEGL